MGCERAEQSTRVMLLIGSKPVSVIFKFPFVRSGNTNK